MFFITLIPLLYTIGQWFYWIISKPRKTEAGITPTSLDILIISRNEAKNLPRLLSQIRQEIGKLNKLILVDDQSEDNSIEIARCFAKEEGSSVMVISNQAELGKSPKKSAIITGVSQSNADWIWMIDADTIIKPGSITHKIEALKKTGSMLLVGPVVEETENAGLWSMLSGIEQSLMNTLYRGSIYRGRPLLCSGANLAFRRKWFLEKNPFQNNLSIFSGDDLAILETAGNSVNFDIGRESVVKTIGPVSGSEFYEQRIRRAGKLRFMGKSYLKIFGLTSIYSGITCLFILPWFLFSGTTLERISAASLLILYILVMGKASNAGYGNERNPGILKTLLIGYIYPLFVLCIPLLIFRGNINWKGRSIP